MNKLFSGLRKKTVSQQPIIVVSGLPRSGTSMMMKILAEGGLPVVTDQSRTADEDNPNGYFELEAVKQMSKGNTEWLARAGGKSVKVISALLEYLPSEYFYKIIFMERDVKEILASQKRMLEHRNQTPKMNDQEMEEQLRAHLAAVRPWLARQPNMEALFVNYNAFMSAPEAFCHKIVDFLDLPLHESKMVSVPTEKLYRNRAMAEKK